MLWCLTPKVKSRRGLLDEDGTVGTDPDAQSCFSVAQDKFIGLYENSDL